MLGSFSGHWCVTFCGFAAFLFFQGCTTALSPVRASIVNVDINIPTSSSGLPSDSVGGKPAWIDNPGDGVSSSAGLHIRGRAAQEELAILRAREEFAKRFGVSVHSTRTVLTSVSADRESNRTSADIFEQMQQSEVRAVVKAKWLDPDSETLWVWLVPYQ